MTWLVRIPSALLLACLSFSVNAETFKCKLPDGSATYQDTPCTQSGSTQQSLSAMTGSVLGMSMSEAAMVGLRANAKRAGEMGTMSKIVSACLSGQDNGRFYSTFQRLLADNLPSEDLKAANAFFDSPAGRKYAKRNLAKIYASLGERPSDPTPILTAAEENQIAEFTATPAGQRLVTQRFLNTAESLPLVVGRIQELYKECGARRW